MCPYSILMIASVLCQCLVPFKASGGVLVPARPVCSSSCSPRSTKDLLSAGQVSGDALTHYRLMDYKRQLNLQIIAYIINHVDPPDHIMSILFFLTLPWERSVFFFVFF